MRDLDDLTMYVYGLLDESGEIDISTHVKGCADCAVQIEQIAAEHRLIEGALSRENLPTSSPLRTLKGDRKRD